MDADNMVLNESDADEEEITAETILKTLQSAWQNERLSPEILPHHNDAVECMLGQIQHMEKNITKLPKTDLRVSIHKMELSRIKYMISNYLKTRLDKIEQFCISILNDERRRITSGASNYLTPSEFKYAEEYLSNMEQHMTSTILSKVPSNMQSFELDKMAINPNINGHVFVKVNVPVNGIVLENISEEQDEEIDLEGGYHCPNTSNGTGAASGLLIMEGSQHILQYKTIADLVKDGKVQLV